MLAALAAAALAASCPARAADAAKERYQKVDYPGVFEATRGIEDCTDGTAEELAEAFRWRAQAHAAQKQPELAVEAFALAVTVSPLYILDPNVAPKVHALFNQARAKVRDEKRVFARVTGRSGTDVSLELFDPRRKANRVVLDWGTGSANATWRGDTSWVATVPGNVGLVTLTVEQSDAEPVVSRDRPVPLEPRLTPTAADEPAAAEPAVEAARQPASSGEVRRWAIIGGAAAGAVVLVAVIAGVAVASSGRTFNGSLGRLEVPPP